MKDKKHSVLSWILGFVAALGFWFAGLMCRNAIPDGFVLSMAVFILIPLIYLINYVGTKRYLNRFNAMPTAQKIAIVSEKQKDAENDLDALIQKRHGTCVKVKVYLIVLVLLTVLMCFLCGTANNEHSPVVQLMLALYMFKDLIFRLFIKDKYEKGETDLAEEDYPVLYAMARDAAKTCDVTDEIMISATGEPVAGVGTVGKTRFLVLGAILLDLFSEEELRQTLLHEFGHLSDTHYTRYRMEAEKLLTFMSCGDDSQPSVMTSVFMRLPYTLLALESELVDIVSSVSDEKRADSIVLEHGDPAAFVSGLAKLNTYSYFNDYCTLPPFYEPEAPRRDINRFLAESYKKEFEANKEQWLYMLEHELPARLDSHPSFPQRREAVGNCDICIEFSDPDTPYRGECRKVMELVDSATFNSLQEDYEQKRKDLYLRQLAVIEEYENSEREYNSAELSPVLNAYRDTVQLDKAEALCDSIIATEENPYATAHALFLKANILLGRYDQSGIELMYRAVELNKNYELNGMDAVGKFCLHMGLEDELQRYRDYVDRYAESGLDEHLAMGELTEKDTLVPEKFPDGRLPDMLDFMVKAGGGIIEEIYLVRKIVSEDFFTSVFILKFAEDAEDEVCGDTWEKIFNYLDTYPDGWQYTLLLHDKDIAKAIKNVPGAQVYKKA